MTGEPFLPPLETTASCYPRPVCPPSTSRCLTGAVPRFFSSLAWAGLRCRAGCLSLPRAGAALQLECPGCSLRRRLLQGTRSGARALQEPQQREGSVLRAPGLWSTGSAAPRHVGSSQMRDQTRLLAWRVNSLPLSPQGSPSHTVLTVCLLSLVITCLLQLSF